MSQDRHWVDYKAVTGGVLMDRHSQRTAVGCGDCSSSLVREPKLAIHTELKNTRKASTQPLPSPATTWKETWDLSPIWHNAANSRNTPTLLNTGKKCSSIWKKTPHKKCKDKHGYAAHAPYKPQTQKSWCGKYDLMNQTGWLAGGAEWEMSQTENLLQRVQSNTETLLWFWFCCCYCITRSPCVALVGLAPNSEVHLPVPPGVLGLQTYPEKFWSARI